MWYGPHTLQQVAGINEDFALQLLEQPMYYMRPQHPSAQQVIGNGTGGFRYVDGRVQQGPYTSGPNANIEPPNKSLYGYGCSIASAALPCGHLQACVLLVAEWVR